ncbi:hypothetical protein Ahy_B01g056413 [Arachis hypogaea]|uniref:Uncharacterized protein n=1 Tax=Arachis hypogaea TaxID=3818 RepID=A0A445AYU6_ARAHY|nr:hypothetical protein Ahy_B01g056413 [Arachis hypogaea]
MESGSSTNVGSRADKTRRGNETREAGLGQDQGSGGINRPEENNVRSPREAADMGPKGSSHDDEADHGSDILYEYVFENFVTSVLSEDERGPVGPDFNKDNAYGDLQFELRMQFATMKQFKMVLKDVFVNDGRDFMYVKNELGRVRVKCIEKDCPRLIYVSINSTSKIFKVKIFYIEYTCGRDYRSNLADRKWVAKKLEKRLKIQPKLTPREAMEHMKQDYNVQLNGKMITHALK